MEDEDFLAAVEADNAGAPEEPVKVELVKEPEPTPEPMPQPEPEQPQAAEPLELTTEQIDQPKADAADGRLLALLEERDKRKAAEAELRTLREAQQAQQQPVQRPDEWEDPDGARAFDQAEVARQFHQMNLRYSERLAKVEHGAEKVAAALQWAEQKCNNDPHFNAKAFASDDPAGFAVAEYDREQIATNVTPSDFAQFQAWKQAQGQLQQTAQAVPPNTASTIPPRSLASAPSAGSMLTEPVQSDDEIFAEVIGKR